jgi:hypothetical protein
MNPQLTATDEIVELLLSSQIQKVAQKLFEINKHALFPVGQDLPIYLCLVDNDTVTLEYVEQILTYEDRYDSTMGKYVRQGQLQKFYKVVGYYNRNLELTILNEFEPTVNDLKAKGVINSSLAIKKMSLLDNAMIGALSMEAVQHAKKFKDASIVANGLNIDLLMTYDGEYLQALLDDKYGVQGVICAR